MTEQSYIAPQSEVIKFYAEQLILTPSNNNSNNKLPDDRDTETPIVIGYTPEPQVP